MISMIVVIVDGWMYIYAYIYIYMRMCIYIYIERERRRERERERERFIHIDDCEIGRTWSRPGRGCRCGPASSGPRRTRRTTTMSFRSAKCNGAYGVFHSVRVMEVYSELFLLNGTMLGVTVVSPPHF